MDINKHTNRQHKTTQDNTRQHKTTDIGPYTSARTSVIARCMGLLKQKTDGKIK